MMIITTTAMFLVQSIILTWIIATNPEPCPKEYVGQTEYCELTYVGFSGAYSVQRMEWTLKDN